MDFHSNTIWNSVSGDTNGYHFCGNMWKYCDGNCDNCGTVVSNTSDNVVWIMPGGKVKPVKISFQETVPIEMFSGAFTITFDEAGNFVPDCAENDEPACADIEELLFSDDDITKDHAQREDGQVGLIDQSL